MDLKQLMHVYQSIKLCFYDCIDTCSSPVLLDVHFVMLSLGKLGEIQATKRYIEVNLKLSSRYESYQ